MKQIIIVIIGFALVFTISCSGAERQAQRADRRHSDSATAVNKERLKLIDDYKKCIDKAGADQEKSEKCDSYLKAAEALN